MQPRRRQRWSTPGRIAWRRRRAAAHVLAAALPVVGALLLGTRSGVPNASLAAGSAGFLVLAFFGWAWGRMDAAALQDPGTPRARALQRFYASPAGVAAALVILALWSVALAAPLLAPRDPLDFTRLGLAPPGAAHWLGTDEIGRDVLSRLLHGARVSLGVGALAAAVAVTIGTGAGLAAGYGGGAVDAVLMRLVDVLLAFPRLFLALLVIAMWGPSIWLVIAVLSLTGWMSTARLVRSQVLSLRGQDFVVAARAAGLPLWRVLARHILPHATAPVLVTATLMVGNAILAESVLSFLGLGVQVPEPSWGSMLNEARTAWRSAWWLATFPGVCITLTVLAHNLLGDALRDSLDPRLDLAGHGRGVEG